MADHWLRWAPAFLLTLSMGGCDFAGDVFEAGFWVALIVPIAVLALIVWVLFQLFD